jgi:excisionase family DNA binding protein
VVHYRARRAFQFACATAMSDDSFLTTEDVLGYLKINLRTVYRLIEAGKIPAIRVGRQWRFRKKDIDTWLNAHGASVRNTSERPRILVVDDEPAVRTLVAKTLEACDYDVETAEDGPSALERMKTASYDLLITDLKMPGMDGLSVVREVRRQSDLPIVILTGFSTEASAIEALNMGVAGYITKPFRLQKVLAVAARALGEPEPVFDSRDPVT